MRDPKAQQPPKLAIQFFRWYCRNDRVEELEGDLEEMFVRRLKNGESKVKTNLFFWWNVIRCYKSYARTDTHYKNNTMSLYQSYFKLAVRHSWKNKGPVLINVLGLGLALSMCMTVYIIHAYNFEFDSFYKNTEGIYRLHGMTLDNGVERRNEATPLALESRLKNDISGISDAVSFFSGGVTIQRGNDYFSEFTGFASTNFFGLFDIPLKYGSVNEFGKLPTAYLNEELATKYFGDEMPVGKTLTVHLGDENKYEVIIGGVFKKIPLNSSFDFNLLLNIDDYIRAQKIDKDDWESGRYIGQFLRIPDQAQVARIEKSIQKYIPFQNEANEEWKMSRFELVSFLTPLNADHIMWRNYVNSRLRPQVLVIFIVLVSLVLFTACFNMANTSMAMISGRLKEIGIRKTLGSVNKQILIQFLFEIGIVNMLAFIVALSTANFTSGSVFGLFGVSFILSDVSTNGVIIFIAIFLIFTTILSGLVPALYAWKFQPVAILRKTVKLKGVNWLNKILTVAQFSFSITVLIAGYTFYQNSDFMDEFDFGYEKDEIIDLQLGGNSFFLPIKQEVDQIPGVITTGTKNHFGNYGSFGDRTDIQIDTAKYEVDFYQVSERYLDVMELELVHGRTFIEGSISDKKNTIIVNSAFAKKFFEGNDPVDQVIKLGNERKTIIGVVENIVDHVFSDSQADPKIYAIADEMEYIHLIVKVVNNDLKSVEDQLKLIWSKHLNSPYNGHLQTEVALAEAGRDSKNLQKIFLTLALLGCFLSIAGIFSLASLNVAKRIKEISIRKVLGASFNQLLVVINRTFIFVLFLSMVVGVTLGYFISDAVLDSIFMYHVDVSVINSLIAGLLIVIVSVITITITVFRPASENPSTGLRNE